MPPWPIRRARALSRRDRRWVHRACCASAAAATDSLLTPRRWYRTRDRAGFGGGIDSLDHRTDPIRITRFDEVRRPFGQVPERIILRGAEWLEPQMTVGETLQSQRRIELGPFRAQHRDGVALFANFGMQPQHAFRAGGGVHR